MPETANRKAWVMASPEVLKELQQGWSRPVQVHATPNPDGSWEMTVRTYNENADLDYKKRTQNQSPYDRHRQECESWAWAWERAAENARLSGDLGLAYSCSQLAIKCRYLAEPDPDVEAIFNRTYRTQGEVDET